MWDCATPATRNEGGCHQAPRLPRKVPRRHARLNRAQGRHPVPWVRRPPRKMTMDVRLRHACHVKRRWMSPSATPATQSAAACRAKRPWMWECATWIVCESVCVWVWVKLVYVKFVCVWSYCMWEMVCDKVVCVWVCVWSYCMLSLRVWSYYMCDKVVCVSVCEVIVC